MDSQRELTVDERDEATRHDKLYKDKARVVILEPRDLETFDVIDNPTHGYIYSVQSLGDIRDKQVVDLGCETGWLTVILLNEERESTE